MRKSRVEAVAACDASQKEDGIDSYLNRLRVESLDCSIIEGSSVTFHRHADGMPGTQSKHLSNLFDFRA